MGSQEENCYEASVNPELGSTVARRLNQSCFPAVLQSNQITIKFGMAEARRLNWAILVEQQSQVKTQVVTYDYNTVRFNCTTVNI